MAQTETLNQLDRIERLLIIMSKEVLDVHEAAMFLKLSENRVRQLQTHNELPYYKDGKNVYFKKSELEECLLKRRVPTNAELAENPLKYSRQIINQ